VTKPDIHGRPAAFHKHPVMAVMESEEEFRRIRTQIGLCQITWPQCYTMGEPLRLTRSATGGLQDAARVEEATTTDAVGSPEA
jgi:hypothetical protein